MSSRTAKYGPGNSTNENGGVRRAGGVSASIKPNTPAWSPTDEDESAETSPAASQQPQDSGKSEKSDASVKLTDPGSSRSGDRRQGWGGAKTKKRRPIIGRRRFVPFSWNTTDELWDLYEGLAIESARAGRKITVSELVRRVLEANLPDLTTDEGKAELVRYASDWLESRGRGDKSSHSINLRIAPETKSDLDAALLDLRAQGKQVPLSSIVSGILNENLPDDAKQFEAIAA